MTPRAIVLDANILLRAVLGSRVPRLLADFAREVTFLTPDVALDEVREHLPAIPVMKRAALARVGPRDPGDWPIMACALLLDCPIWTEDRDFFGTGVATWTTTLVEQYFANPGPD